MVYFIIPSVFISQQYNKIRPLKTFCIVPLHDLWYRPIESKQGKDLNSKIFHDINDVKKFLQFTAT